MIDCRRAAKSDIKKINEINIEAFDKDATSDLEKVIENPVYPVFVATVDGVIAGFFEITIVAGEAEIVFIATKEKYRHQGVADYMMQFIVDYAKLNGASKLYLEVESSNIPACNLYQKFGFTHEYKRANYYGKNRNAIVMKKDL